MGDSITDIVVKAFGVGFLISVLVIVSCLVGAIFGAFTGWILQMTFLGDWITNAFLIFGFNAQGHLVEIGAMLGFIGGFFKTTNSNYNTEKD